MHVASTQPFVARQVSSDLIVYPNVRYHNPESTHSGQHNLLLQITNHQPEHWHNNVETTIRKKKTAMVARDRSRATSTPNVYVVHSATEDGVAENSLEDGRGRYVGRHGGEWGRRRPSGMRTENERGVSWVDVPTASFGEDSVIVGVQAPSVYTSAAEIVMEEIFQRVLK
jgi:hypothetical protein